MFTFKKFTVQQDQSAMKVTTDGCLFGAWVAGRLSTRFLHTPARILDIGAGTGLLSLMIAQQVPTALIDAIELEEGAYRQAKNNFKNSPWGNRLKSIHADARQLESVEKYDVIISNPPFYENEWSSENPGRRIAHHGTGLMLKELMQVINRQLHEKGVFYLLLPYKRIAEVRYLLAGAGFSISSLVFARQTPSHEYFRILLEGYKGLKKKEELIFDEIIIKMENDSYSDDFISLLKDYYLYL